MMRKNLLFSYLNRIWSKCIIINRRGRDVRELVKIKAAGIYLFPEEYDEMIK